MRHDLPGRWRQKPPWSGWECHALRLLWRHGIRVVTIARMLGRTRGAVNKRAQALELGRHPPRHVRLIG